MKEKFKNMSKEEKRKYFIFIGTFALIVILAIGGLTYAWFSATVTGNEEAESTVVETGTLSIVYTNSQELKGESILPGWSETKTFTVENTGTVTAKYNINWENLTNEFVNKEDLVYTLTSTNNGGNLTETQIPDSGEHISILSNISIEPSVIQEYTLTITYKESGSDQNSDKGKKLLGKIEVLDINQFVPTQASSYITSLYSESNTEGLIEVKQPETDQMKETTEYRYSGSNDTVKNYVTFNDELWRIIGVFDVDDGNGTYESRVKIVRDESIGAYSWDTSPSGVNDFVSNEKQYYGGGINQWGASGSYEGADLMRLLNDGYSSETVNNSLYYNKASGNCYTLQNNTTSACDFIELGLKNEVKSLIATSKWYTASSNLTKTTSVVYKEERANTTEGFSSADGVTRTVNWTGKVGLIYASDYGYASSACYNTDLTIYNYNDTLCTESNWLYKGIVYRTITPNVSEAQSIFTVDNVGFMSRSKAYYPHNILPSLYLDSSVKITDGIGTLSDPYLLSL